MPESKSKPFEIRASILCLARDILSEGMHLSMDRAKHGTGDMPVPYTAEQVILEAEKLYTFVVSKR